MNTDELMDVALSLSGLNKIPSDSVISVKGNNIKKILIGLDMEVAELLLAEKLGYDCVVSHHPKADSARVNFFKVMEEFQIDRMVEFGVPINKAQKALRKKQTSIDIRDHSQNYDRVSSVAKLLNMPYMNIHTPADLVSQRIVQKYLDKKFENHPKKLLKEVLITLYEINEYQRSITKPLIRVGSDTSYAGKIAVLMAGGTNGGIEVFKTYFDSGIGTIITMATPEEIINTIKDQNIGNIIVAGHLASDSIGLNKIINEWEKRGMIVDKISGIL